MSFSETGIPIQQAITRGTNVRVHQAADSPLPAPQVHIVAPSRRGFRQVLWLSSDAFGGLALCHGEASLSKRAGPLHGTPAESPHVSSIQTGIRLGGTLPRGLFRSRRRSGRESPQIVTIPVPATATPRPDAEGPEQIEVVNKLASGMRLTIRVRDRTVVSLRLETLDRLRIRRPNDQEPWTARLDPSGEVSLDSSTHAEPDVNIWLEL